MSFPAQSSYVPFEGEKTRWHDDFDRYDYVMDANTLAITPFVRPDSEGFSVSPPAAGQRRCIVVCPKHPAPGNPWSWQACYWDHQPQTEVELLHRGFHIVYISADAQLAPDKCWDAWYDYLTQKHGFAKKPVFVGMSRGGQYEFRWATTHPDQVSGIYGDNPAADEGIFRNLPALAKQDVPIFFVCGTNDPLLPQHALPMEAMYQQFGGRVSIMLKDGAGHHPHSLHDPKPIADFLERSFGERTPEIPDFVATNKFERSTYYPIENHYAWHSEDGYYITQRGAAFAPCYNQYRVSLGFETAVTVIAPQKEAPGRPWVLRSNFVPRDAALDQALLAKGFHIVVGPIGYNADGPNLADWNKLYDHLTAHGFAKEAVIEGEGGSAGAVYAWAVVNPEKVACAVAKDPIMNAAGVEKQPLDNLKPLAQAGVKLLHVCVSSDPGLAEIEAEVEKRYRSFGGEITVLRSAGTTETIVDFILKRTGQ